MKDLKHHIIFACWLMISAMAFTPAVQAQFSIGPGGFVTVKAGGSMMIGTDLHIKSVAGSSGYLVDQNVNGAITITGDVTVDRYMTANSWHNVASPVSNETNSCFTNTDLVFWYDESLILNDWNFGWVWYTGATGGPLMVFRGYDVYFDNAAVTVNYYATGTGIDTLNTGPYTISVINTNSTPGEIATQKGWNLLGNPYPSPVDWLAASGWDKSDINDAKYIWEGADSIYTIFIGGSFPDSINGGTRFIPSNQGFWVQAVVPAGTVGINNAVRVGDITGTPDFYKLKPVDYPRVSLVASGNNKSDEAVIRFIKSTTEGFDVNYDASKLFSPSPNAPQISIQAGNQILALNSLPELKDNLAVLLNFQCGKAGFYKISLNKRTNLDLNTKVYLKDELEKTIISLTADSAYSFYHKSANDKNRFKVYFNPSADILNGITPESYFIVYAEKNIITILKNTVQNVSGDIAVYNMLGQSVWWGNLSNDDKSSIRLNLPTGYYIVNIITDQQVFNAKILINN